MKGVTEMLSIKNKNETINDKNSVNSIIKVFVCCCCIFILAIFLSIVAMIFPLGTYLWDFTDVTIFGLSRPNFSYALKQGAWAGTLGIAIYLWGRKSPYIALAVIIVVIYTLWNFIMWSMITP